MEPSADPKTARSSLRVLSQLFGGPPDSVFFPLAICATIIRLGTGMDYNRYVSKLDYTTRSTSYLVPGIREER